MASSAAVGARHSSGLRALSPSRATDFKTCPRLFRYKVVDRLPVPPTPAQARGTTAHLALERLFDLPAAERTPARLYDLFRRAWMELRDRRFPELFDSVDDERAWGTGALELLANYFSVEDPAAIEPIHREFDVTRSLGRMRIRGIMDRVDETDGNIVIVDYKTGKPPAPRFAASAFFASKVYALLYRAETGRTPTALRLVYLAGPAVLELPVDDRMLAATRRQLEALWTAIERALTRNEFPPRPGPLCGWCPFLGICPAVEDPTAASTGRADAMTPEVT